MPRLYIARVELPKASHNQDALLSLHMKKIFRRPYLPTFLSATRPTLFSPSFAPHTLLYPRPYPLYDFPIPPSPLHTETRIPLLHLGAHNAPPPALHRAWYVLSSPTNINTERMPKQVWCILPFVALELPRLPCSKYCNYTVPVIGLELLWGVNEDEAQGTVCVDARE